MSLIHNSRHKIKNVQRTIDGILNADHPFASGKKALKKLLSVFADLEKQLDRAARLNDHASVASLASNINVKILQVLPILGFVLRSTNVRNAFELIEPLQFIARSAMQGKPELVLSSEWDYVPFAYPQSFEDLRSHVLIGLPASEAASALLVPIAGHELGHAVWRNRGLSGNFQTMLKQSLSDLYRDNNGDFRKAFPEFDENDVFRRQVHDDALDDSLEFAELQAEELFCDLFAYSLFGASYLHAFAYILAPGAGGHRSGKYPSYDKRISTIERIAKSEGVTLPKSLQFGFRQDEKSHDPGHRFVVRMADEAADVAVPLLWQRNLKVLAESELQRPISANSIRQLKDLQLGVPSSNAECLGDILNAGWLRYEEIIASGESTAKLSDNVDRLNELLLKTIEVNEFSRRTKQ